MWYAVAKRNLAALLPEFTFLAGPLANFFHASALQLKVIGKVARFAPCPETEPCEKVSLDYTF